MKNKCEKKHNLLVFYLYIIKNIEIFPFEI